ncbi:MULTISPECIES: general secretion pathway protein GspK [Bradyrhizobium]|nr:MULTISPECIES: type II secretion system protein GspK [Bradyrhizobium]MCG2628166.1 general secretion pathway protein GspK [Bradyrhizobium zhengyangense]GGI25879.1 hypothetical protein GCM10010987_36600 [Bradyrhizobium guangdongense]
MIFCNPQEGHLSGGREGFILIAVLWMLIALATLASIYSIYIGSSSWSSSVIERRLQADQLVSASLNLATQRLAVADQRDRPTHGHFSFRLGQANASVRFVSEAARLDLNQAPRELLSSFFIAIGASEEDAPRFAARIVGWRERLRPSDRANEAQLYRAAGRGYGPRGAPFAHVGELWLVQGLPQVIIERMLPLVTVYSGRSDINVFDAPPELVAALPGMTLDRLNGFLGQRQLVAPSKDALVRLLGSDQTAATADASDAFRLDIKIGGAGGWNSCAEAVILLQGPDDPFHILAWDDSLRGDCRQGMATANPP